MHEPRHTENPGGDYEVGYGKPPKHTRFRPGQSGNPKGRPAGDESDIARLLNTPVKVAVEGHTRRMQPFEVSFRQLVKRALKGHVPSLIKVIRLFEEFGVLKDPPADPFPSVVFAPKGVDFQDWFYAVTEEIPADEIDDTDDGEV